MYQNWYPTPYNYQHSIYPNSSQYSNFDQCQTNSAYYYQQKFDPFYYQYQQNKVESFLPHNSQSSSVSNYSNYDSSNYSKSNGKREAEKDENDQDYSNQPSKRFNSQGSANIFLNNLQLPISPVNFASVIQPKIEYNEHSSDESLNSTDYLSYMNSLSAHSTISPESLAINGHYSASKNYLPCLTNNESGYYSQSPNSIALNLDMGNNQNESSD